MTTFLDSSAIVTLYVQEPGRSPELSGALAVSELARVEVPSALWRKHRLGEVNRDLCAVLVAAFEADYFGTTSEAPRFSAVAATGEVLDEAARLCEEHGLRAYDAVQLASALAARRVDPQCSTMAVYDNALRGAAQAEGFRLVP